MDLSKQTVLITGADGFIGSHLVEHLVPQVKQVRALVLYNSFNNWGWLDSCDPAIKDAIDVRAGDIRDPHLMQSIVSGCTSIIHLAALIPIPYSYLAPASYIDINVHGTLNLLQSARQHNVERFIHTSTSEVYGTAQQVPIPEEHRLNAQSPYAASKVAADQLALSFQAAFELPVTIARPFNTYGPRQSARAVIPTVISQIAAKQQQIKLGSITPTRDFNFIADQVRGFSSLLAAEQVAGEVFNFGTGFEATIEDTVKLIAELMGESVEIICDQARIRPEQSEVERLCADSNKAKQVLNWQPEYPGMSGLENGLRQTIEWFSQPENLRLYKPEVYNV